jgi:TonB-dependent starch-binding outer membrane protein SusC
MRPPIAFAGMLVLAAPQLQSLQRAAPASPLDRSVTLALERVPLKDALDEVARQAGARIAYARRVVPLDQRVTMQLAAVPARVALDALLLGTGAASTVDPTGQILITAGRVEDRAVRDPGSIAGSVRDATARTPLAGAAVVVVGTRLSAQTDGDGRYTIPGVPPGTYRLRARMLGFAPADTSVEVADGQQVVVDFELQRSALELNPVVSIGYATTTRNDLTGAVASVTADEFNTSATPMLTLSSGLQGKAAGVQVISNSGLPGGGLRVRVRGTGSITANSEPLYVIDGIPAEQGTGSSNPQNNPLMSLDPNEIESIDVLKDASATAIYGARGANGVVLIATRRGRLGVNSVTLESSAGYQEISKTIPVLNAQEFMRLTNEALINGNVVGARLFPDSEIAAAQTYDYPAMMLRTGAQATQAITLTGGDQRLRYLLSGSYTSQQGIEIGSNFKRHGVRLNVDGEMSSRFRAGTSLSMTRVARNAAAVENGALGNSANGIQAAMQFAPYQAPKDPNGAWIKSSPSGEPVPNPVANATELTDYNSTTRLLGSVYGELDLAPALTARSTFAGNFQFDKINFFAPRTIQAGGVGGTGWIDSDERRDLTNENTVTYRGRLGPGSVDVLGGFSVQTFYNDGVRADGANFPTDATSNYNLGSGSQLVPASSEINESALVSYMARANYNVAGKYLFTLTGRYDGSSRFGANNKWAFFPSGAVAWRLSDEGFMRNQSIFSDLKLRLSYGQVGNQAVEPYQSLARLVIRWASFGGTEIPALAPADTMPNPDLRWEQQTQLNAGVDAVFADGRVSLSFDTYRSVTHDLLLRVTLPSTTGFTNQLRNVGSVRNRGVELSLSTVNVQGSRFTWRSTLNVAHNRNKVVDLGTALNAQGQRVPITQMLVTARGGTLFWGSETHTVRVGQPLGAIYGYQVTGLWQAGDACYLDNPLANCVPGEYKIADLNGDRAINSADRTILGYGDPEFYGGLTNTWTYGPLSLDAFLTFTYGNKILNGGKAYGGLAMMQANERKPVLDRWTPTNTDTDVPRANQSRTRRVYSTLVEDGSYLRLQTVTLGYRLPPRLFRGLETARLFLTGQNLWIATRYSGFDPDVNSMGGDARFGGVDIGAYPRSRTWNFGVSATF